MTYESERHRTERLDREGRLEAFNVRVAQLKAPCKTKPERQAAWARVVAEFTDREPLASDAGDEGSGVDASVFEGKTAPTSEAVAWVSRHLEIRDVRASHAPSSDSWALLCWAKAAPANARAFWERLFVALLPTRPTTGEPRGSWESLSDPKSYGETEKAVLQASLDARGEFWSGIEKMFIEYPDNWAKVKRNVEAGIERSKRSFGEHTEGNDNDNDTDT